MSASDVKKTKLHDEIGNFVTVPESVIEMWPKIGLDAFSLFVYLRYRTNHKNRVAFPSYSTIAKETTLRRERIAKAIRVLEEHKLLERQKRFGASTVYTLKAPPPITPSSPGGGLLDEPPVVRGADSSSPGGGLSVVRGADTNKIDLNKTDLNKTDHGADKPRPRDELFDAISESCAVDPATAGPSIGKVKTALLKASPPYTADEVRAWRATWPVWKDKPPTLWQLKEQIGAIRTRSNGNTNGGTNGSHREGSGQTQLSDAERERLQRLADKINTRRAEKRAAQSGAS